MLSSAASEASKNRHPLFHVSSANKASEGIVNTKLDQK